MAYRYDIVKDIYKQAMALPKGDLQRDAKFFEALRIKMETDWAEARKIGPDATPLDLFCKKHSVPSTLIERTVDELGTYATIKRITQQKIEKKAKRLGLKDTDDITFSPKEAVDIVVNAFSAFDPDMERIVREAYQQGRISFAPTIYGAESDLSGYAGDVPDDIERLPANLRRLPYVSVPFQPEQKLVYLDDLFMLAHECAHLAAFQKHRERHPRTTENSYCINYPVQETFSLMGERLLHHYLINQPSKDALWRYRINNEWLENIDLNLLSCAKMAEIQQKISHEYEHNRAPLLDMQQIDVIAKETFPDKVNVWQDEVLLLRVPFYHTSYPLGVAASYALFERWEKGSRAEKQQLARRWAHVQEMSGSLNFTQAMNADHMTIDIQGNNFLQNALDDLETHERNLEASLDELYSERARSALHTRIKKGFVERADRTRKPPAQRGGNHDDRSHRSK